MRIIAIIIPLMWGTVIFGHGKEKHEPKIIDDNKMDCSLLFLCFYANPRARIDA